LSGVADNFTGSRRGEESEVALRLPEAACRGGSRLSGHVILKTIHHVILNLIQDLAVANLDSGSSPE